MFTWGLWARFRFRSSTLGAGGVQCGFLCLCVVVGIVGEDRGLQTPADVVPLYAGIVWDMSVEWKYPFFTLELDFGVAWALTSLFSRWVQRGRP